MIVGACRLELSLPEGHSLKEKRMVLRSITAKVRNTFNVSVAEVDTQDLWQVATLGIACVSNDSRHANEMLSKVVSYIENLRSDGELADYEIELVHVLSR